MKNQTPPNLPPVPNDFIYCGYGPLKVKAIGKNAKDVAGAVPNEVNWTIGGLSGCGDTVYYALRKGSEIARLNGLEEVKVQLPAGVTAPPDETIFFGNGPLKVKATGNQYKDVYFYEGTGDTWDAGYNGDSSSGWYALRKNSEIANLNGLTETMKTQTYTKQMKLKLQALNNDEIQLPSGMVAFRIVEQEGFANSKIYESDEHTFRSIYLPDFCYEDKKITFYLRGRENSKDNRIMVIPRVKYDKLVAAIDSLLKKENAPKILYTATFFYKNEKNGSQKRRMIEVIKEDATYLEGNDKDDGGKYKKFLKSNVIGAIDKVKS